MKPVSFTTKLLATTAWMSLSTAALAQTSVVETTPAPTSQDAPIEDEIIVVGTNIKGANVADILPVTVLGSPEIEATGALTYEELLGNLPQAGELAFNSDRELSNDARGDIASLNLRTLGADTSLVLVNGRRIVSHAHTQTFNSVPIQFTNMNAIPTVGIGRVEVLRDGASAIYGSDAIAGVLNTVIRDDYDGLRVSGRYGWSEGTDLNEKLFRATGGTETEDGRSRISVSASIFDREGLDASERDYSRDADKRTLLDENDPFFGNIRLRNNSSFGLYGEFRVGTPDGSSDRIRGRRVRRNGTSLTTSSGQFHIQPTGVFANSRQAGYLFNPELGLEIDDGSSTSTSLTTGNGIEGANGIVTNPLRYNMNEFRKLTPDAKRYNLSAAVSHDFSDDVEGFADFIYYHSDSSKFFGPPVLSTSNNFTIPANYYWNPFGPTTLANGAANPNRIDGIDAPDAGYDVQIRRARFIDLGPRLIDVKQQQYRLLGGFRGVKKNWDWETAIGYSESKAEDVGLLISRTLLFNELSRTDAGAYNIFSGNMGNGNAGQRFGVDVTRDSTNSLLTVDAKISRPDLFEFNGKDIGFAAGAEFRRETIHDDRDSRLDGSTGFTNPITGQVFDSDILGVSATPDVKAGRNVISAYAEAIVPLVYDRPFMDSLELQIAGRFEDYSDVDGSVFKPRVAASWFINEDLQLRGAWSQGFRAPNLVQINQPAFERFTNSQVDYAACTFMNVCDGEAVTARTSGNPDLQPENSDNFSIGATWQPQNFLDGLTLTVDYWNIKLEDSVGVIGRRNHIALDEYLRRTQGTSNAAVLRDDPTQEQIDAVAAYNAANGTNIAAFGNIRFVNDQFLNLSPREVTGLDITGQYKLYTDNYGDFTFNANLAHLIKYEQQASPVLSPLVTDAVSSTTANNAGSAFLDPESVGDLIRVESRPEWRFSGSVRWDMNNWRLGSTISYVSDVYDPDVTATVNGETVFFPIDSFTRVGAYAQYTFDEGMADGLRLKAGVRNIFDKEPPLFDNSAGYSSSLHSNRGRYIYFDVAKKF